MSGVERAPLAGDALDAALARLLAIGTFAGVGLLALGVGLMAAAGRSPLDPHTTFDLARIPADIAAGRPEGVLWLGLLVVIATPSARVAASLAGFARAGERAMVAVSAAILLVIAVGVVIGTVLGESAA